MLTVRLHPAPEPVLSLTVVATVYVSDWSLFVKVIGVAPVAVPLVENKVPGVTPAFTAALDVGTRRRARAA
jgi:hypothetical protein